MNTDPAERRLLLRHFYRNWRPTRLGRWVNRFAAWLALHGVRDDRLAVLEVRGRSSGTVRRTPVVIASLGGQRYLVSMLGTNSDWVKNVTAAHGHAVLLQPRPEHIRLEPVPPEERAPVLQQYVRVATSGRHHFPVHVDAPADEFERIAAGYPVFRIESMGAPVR